MSFIETLRYLDRKRIHIFICVVLATQCVGYFWPLVVLDNEQKLYIFSTQAQIIAGIYALTVAGYVFMTEQRLRLVAADDTLKTTIDKVAADQYRGLIFLAVTVVVCLSSCLIALLLKQEVGIFPMVIGNLAGASFALGIAFIVLFVCHAMNPKLLEVKSDQIKAELTQEVESIPDADLPSGIDEEVESFDSDQKPVSILVETDGIAPPRLDEKASIGISEIKGSSFLVGSDRYKRFMREYNRLGEELQKLYISAARAEYATASVISSVRRKKSIGKMVEELTKLKVIEPTLAARIRTVHAYRNVLVHSSDTAVSAKMILLANLARLGVSKVVVERNRDMFR